MGERATVRPTHPRAGDRAPALLRRPRIALAVAGPLAVLSAALLALHTGGEFIDLEVYRFGVQAWFAGGDPYVPLPPTSAGITLPYIYPPFAVLLMVPLTVVPQAVAAAGLFTLSTLALGVTLYVVARRLWPSGGRGPALAAAAGALPAALWLEPVRETYGFGQVNLLLMALVAVDCLAGHPRWPRGTLVGIAAAIKLTPAVFVLFFLLRRDRRAAVTAVVTAAGATALAFAAAPAASLRFWLENPAAGVGASPFFTNQAFPAVLVRAGVDGVARTLLWALLSVGLIALAAPAVRRAPAPLALVAVAGVGLLVSPTSWSHHWVWIAPALLVAAATAWRARSAGWAVVAAAAALVFLAAPHARGLPRAGGLELAWTPVQQLVGSTYVWFTVLLFVLLGAVWWRRGRAAT